MIPPSAACWLASSQAWLLESNIMGLLRFRGLGGFRRFRVDPRNAWTSMLSGPIR